MKRLTLSLSNVMKTEKFYSSRRLQEWEALILPKWWKRHPISTFGPEWAAIENALVKGIDYQLPKVKKEYAGIVLTLSKYQHPDLLLSTMRKFALECH